MRPVICFGEALWDVFPRTSWPGGAPLNVAVQLRRLGRAVIPVSAVGRDAAGDRLLALISQERVPIRGIARHPTLPTGRVEVTVDSTGEVSYEICAPAAWDEIPILPEVALEMPAAAALVFGTLAQRSASNRVTLDGLLSILPEDALSVLDVNFRPPFVDLERAWHLAHCADVIKVSDGELSQMVDGEIESAARELASRCDCQTVCVTMGEKGAGILAGGEWTATHAEAITPVDPVGAGDAFVAALVAGMLASSPMRDVLADATRLAASVASRIGAW